MKKYLIVSLILMPFLAHAQLMGFGDGAGLYDETGKQIYTCFQDQTCVGVDNIIHTRTELGVGPIPTTALPITGDVSVSQQPVYIPVYSTPANTPVQPSQPSAAVSNPVDIQPSCTLTTTDDNIDTNPDYSITATWTTTNVATSTLGHLYVANKMDGGVPIWDSHFSYLPLQAPSGSQANLPTNQINYKAVFGDAVCYSKTVFVK